MDTPALRGVNNTGGSTQRQLVSYEQFNNSTQTALDRASGNPSRQLLTQPLTQPLTIPSPGNGYPAVAGDGGE